MIDGKTLKFGYGDIVVDADPFTRSMVFQQFRPPGKCGDDIVVTDVDLIGEMITIKIGYKDYENLDELFNKVRAREISEFTFKEYTFDFTNYNEKSVEACKRELVKIMKFYFLAMVA